MDNALSCGVSTIRQVAWLIGKINATQPANRWAPLLTSWMEIEKNTALKLNRYDFESEIVLSQGAQTDLKYVREHLTLSQAPILCPKVDYTIYTDASSQGWGCFEPQTKRSGAVGGQKVRNSTISTFWKFRQSSWVLKVFVEDTTWTMLG